MRYIVYNQKGKILRTGTCSNVDFLLQAGEDEFIMEGTANDARQKIVNGRIVDKTPQEIEADNPTLPKIPIEKQPARITNEQWQKVLNRLEVLEAK